MSPQGHGSEPLMPTAGCYFATTHWSVIVAAGTGSESPQARDALERLCRAYWYPLYVFIRRHGHNPHDAQDLAQEFFARLIRKQSLAGVRPEKGRFRSFLLSSLKHFLSDERDRANAQKRGGGQPLLSLGDPDAEARYALEAQDQSSPDRLFDRRWAYALLEKVMGRLQDEFAAGGKGALFEAFRPFMVGESERLSYLEVGQRLGLTEAAAKMTVTRMRQRYRRLLREEVANTVADAAAIDDELHYLFSVLH